MRSIIATSLAVIYLTILLSPFASLAMDSKTVAHALTGECSGDCSICGCSAESRATRTCCCSKKKQQQARIQENEDDAIPDCCKKVPAKEKIMIASCGSPCGTGKAMALPGDKTDEILVYYFTAQFVLPQVTSRYPELSHHLISLHVEPPDPPPRQA